MDKNKTKSKHPKYTKQSKIQKAIEEIEELKKRIINEVPPTGKFCKTIVSKPDQSNDNLEKWEQPISKFKDLPLSQKTINGLSETKYYKLTPIQRATLPHSLAGRDILAASKTGSGKTLCFLIPLLECLYRERWSKEEGLGALVILPTRELAIQVFEVLNKIGKFHNFSVGLVIGGNNVEKEKEAINYMNILIGTPGRILQHVTETAMFTADNLKMLIIDEADRILDEGFEENITEILNYLPTNRQTLLFSATLTKNLKRLVKLKLSSPEYINLSNTDSVITNEVDIEELNKNELSIMKSQSNEIAKIEDENSGLIPKNLNQFYTIVEAHEKVDVLYSFFKTHKMSKCLVFVTSVKQVRFFSEVFKKLKLGMTILDLHGRQSQGKRSSTFYTFSQKRNSVVLFATDVLSRGVDFPAIDWVIQLDAPEDISAYIHRVGRTARYKSEGSAILFVSAKEEAFVEELKQKKIEIRKMKFQRNKIKPMAAVVRSIISEKPDMVQMAEKAVSSYIKSVALFSNKKVFDIKSIDLNKLCLSYGIVSAPKLVVKKEEEVKEEIKEEIKEEKKMEEEEEPKKKKSKLEKLKEKIKQKKMMKQSKEKTIEEEEDFLVEKKKDDTLLSKKTKREDNEEEEEETAKKVKKNKEEDDEEKNDYYERVKKRLEKNKESDKIKEKTRILEKHKQDRINQKQKDYEKHGLLADEEENEEDEESNKINYDIEEEEPKDKIKINVNKASLEEKENAALELLKKKNKLFG